ncbi:MAG: thioredoxin family protein [Bacteroidales bacterium]|nr:thioredoxin family protein [Bacteroidales bacterium]
MAKIHKMLTIFLLACVPAAFFAQVLEPVKWQNSIKQTGEKDFEIVFKAEIDKGWHLYGLNIPEGGPVPTSFNFEPDGAFELLGPAIPTIKPQKVFDNTFGMDLELFDGTVAFKQKIKLTGNKATIKGFIEFMSCDDSRCLPPASKNFEFSAMAASKAAQPLPATDKTGPEKNINNVKEVTITDVTVRHEPLASQEITAVSEDVQKEEKGGSKAEKTLWEVFLEALAKGILAVFTPCVWPIIPLTVAFFMRDNSTGRRIFQALFFGVSIVAVYASVGLLAGLAGIDIVELSKHWLANLIIFLLLFLVAASFFGMFEIVLPGSISNKLDKQVDKGGLMAPFFLALVTAVVSFSCVGPFAGIALGAALTGEVLMPTVAMTGFAISFAFPFVLIGIFPGLIKKMPKSGGWLNSVKVFFAFVVLAASLIFLGNTQWKIFNRDVILSLEIVIFALLGFYLLGKIKFAHDSDLPYIKVPRLVLAIISFAVAIYLVPGLFGSPLKAFSAFLPAPETAGFSLAGATGEPGVTKVHASNTLCDSAPKHAGFLHLPHNLSGYFDYHEGLACAKSQNKPVFIDFVGHTCKNCKKMYADVWSDSRILELLRNEFIIIALYTDDRTELPENEWVVSEIDGRAKKTIGAKNLDLEISKFKTNALPLYVIMDSNENILTTEKYYTYNTSRDKFLAFLQEGISNFKQKK